MGDWNYKKFVALTRAHADMMVDLKYRAKQILDRMKHRGALVRADEYGAVVEYNTSCHCHPESAEFTFPAEWLFAEDWQAKVDEHLRAANEKKQKQEQANQRLREEQERKDLARLQAKYPSQ